MFSQVEAKKFYRYSILREELYFLNSSGYYLKNKLHQIAKDTGISYNTLRADLKHFQRQGLIIICGDRIKFNKLTTKHLNWFKIFTTYRNEIVNADKPAIYFTDLIKKRTIHYFVMLQVKKEAEKIIDKKLRRKYRQLVTNSNSAVGEKQGVNLSLDTIAKYFGKCKTTAFKYVGRMHKTGVMKITKNYSRICRVEEWNAHLNEVYRNRTFFKAGFIYERKSNSYAF